MIAYPYPTSTKKPCVTVEEYLERERIAEMKSEYYDGEVEPMPGGSPSHDTISTNVGGELYLQLKGKPCRAFIENRRVFVDECNVYFYPDVVAVCGEPKYNSDNPPALLNPTAVIEVLSESTEGNDRGRKFFCYRTLSSLMEMVFITQSAPLVERYAQNGNGKWTLETIMGLDAVIVLTSLDCELRLSDIYDRIEFPANIAPVS